MTPPHPGSTRTVTPVPYTTRVRSPALPGVHYWLAGTGEEEARYRALARERGVEQRVHFLGPVANADLPQLYRAADAVVMPSASEGLANAWAEALACGTPLVISDADGAAELVTASVGGRIVKSERASGRTEGGRNVKNRG